MLGLCQTVHSLLGFPGPERRCRNIYPRGRQIRSASGGAGLSCVAGDLPGPPPHVVESAAVGSKPPPLSPPPEEGPEGEAPASGCLYGRGSGAGLELCTESLGFESCCDGRVGEEERRAEQEIRRRIDECKRRPPNEREGDDELRRRKERSTRRRRPRRTGAKEFPPPLPSLGSRGAGGGRSSSFLKAVKRDGRLVLTEVRVERPSIFRASRQDGRLRLELVKSEEPEQPDEEESAREGEEEAAAEEVAGDAAATTAAAEKEELEEEEEEGEAEKEEEQRWRQVPAVPERWREGGELAREGRCQEAVMRRSLQPSPFWSTRFVTTA